MADFPNLHPNLNTQTRYPMAETRDLKCAPANPPVSGFTWLACVPNSQHLPWVGTALRAVRPAGSESPPYLETRLSEGAQPHPRQLGQHAVLTLPRDSVLK